MITNEKIADVNGATVRSWRQMMTDMADVRSDGFKVRLLGPDAELNTVVETARQRIEASRIARAALPGLYETCSATLAAFKACDRGAPEREALADAVSAASREASAAYKAAIAAVPEDEVSPIRRPPIPNFWRD